MPELSRPFSGKVLRRLLAMIAFTARRWLASSGGVISRFSQFSDADSTITKAASRPRGMSWLQVYTLRLRCYEHLAASGRVVFVIQLHVGQQDDSRATDLAKRSYSEFRALWKDLLRATSGSVDDIDTRGGNFRETRRFSGRESWRSVSKLLTSTLASGVGVGIGRSSTKTKARCRCTQASCPFQRLHHLLKDFPFPRKQPLQHKDANALQQRRAELEEFLVQLQRFFCGYPRSFLETAASTQRCEVLQLVSAFTGMDNRPVSLSVVHSAFTQNAAIERVRYFSYCVSPLPSPSATEATDKTDDAMLAEERTTDNQIDQLESSVQERFSRASIRSSAVWSASSSSSLPQLHVKNANVKTYDASLIEIRDNILRQMDDKVQVAIQQKQLSEERRWEFALFHAAERGLYADLVTIIRRGTNVNSTMWDETTALHAASGAGQIHVVQCLLSNGAQVDHQGPKGMTPLMYAVNNSQLETTKLLLRAGADVNLCNSRNVSPVHLAVVNNSMPMLLLLLDHGATVDVPNAVNGRTPLHIAAEAGYKEMCEILLTYGARVSQCSASGRNAKELASAHGHWRIEELCNQYRRDTFLENNPHSELKESLLEDGCSHSKGRVFRAALEYISEDGDGTAASDAKKDDVSIVSQEGKIYAVL